MRKLSKAWLGGYEERVRFFFGLLIFVLAAANGANFLLLRSAWLSLRDAVEDSVDARGALAASRTLETMVPPTSRAAGTVPMSALVRVAGSSGCLGLALVDPSGHVLASTYGAPGGSRDEDFPPALALTPPSPEGISFRPSTRIVDRGGVMIRYQAIREPGTGSVVLVKSLHDTEDLASTEWRYRTLVWTQTITILVVLVAAFAFGRWISLPYRMMAREAGAVTFPEGTRDPEDLVAAFRRVMEKLRAQDEELRALHLETRTGGPAPFGFAAGIARGMTSGLIVLGSHGGFVAANPAAGRILGWEDPPDPGDPVETWAGSDSPLTRLIRGSLGGEHPRSREEIEHVPPRGSGRRLHLGVSISPVQGDPAPEAEPRESAGGRGAGGGTAARAGEGLPGAAAAGSRPGQVPEAGRGPGPSPGAQGVVCLIADLTEVRELEQRVRRREQLAALGTVSAGIAHEVRNALATILGHARLAEKGGSLPAQEHARAIEREVRAIGGTVEDFLRFSRPARLSLSEVSLRGLLEQVVEEAGPAGLLDRMDVEVTGEGGTIRGDEQALRQAFSNLVRNAAESSERRVHLRIGIGVQPGQAIVTFTDDGDGIPREHLDLVFVPFFTTRGRGTGIGLALTQKTILDHEGTIEVEPGPGGGTTFRVLLPVPV